MLRPVFLPYTQHHRALLSQQIQNICITFYNVLDVGSRLYKCYTKVLCLLGSRSWHRAPSLCMLEITCLKLNPRKTEFLLIGTKLQREKFLYNFSCLILHPRHKSICICQKSWCTCKTCCSYPWSALNSKKSVLRSCQANCSGTGQ